MQWIWMPIVALTAAQASAGTTYYVRTSGNDANSGKSPSAAWRTVAKAFETASKGDTVYIGAGTYDHVLPKPKKGTPTKWIRFIGDTTGYYTGDAGTVILARPSGDAVNLGATQYVELENLTIRGGANGVKIEKKGIITLRGCVIEDSTTVGVYVDHNAKVSIKKCTVRNTGTRGVDIRDLGTVTITGTSFASFGEAGVVAAGKHPLLSVYGSTFTLGGKKGINTTKGTATVANCIMTGPGIGIYAEGKTAQVWNNVFSGCTVAVQGKSALTARNNIITLCTKGIERLGGSVTAGYNLFFSNTSNYSGASGSNDLSGNPMFVGAGDFHLQAGSPAINTGTSAAAIITSDKDGNTRPWGGGWDIGAYEFNAPPAVPPLRILEWVEVPR